MIVGVWDFGEKLEVRDLDLGVVGVVLDEIIWR